MRPELFDHRPADPLDFRIWDGPDPAHWAGVRETCFEITSRGDRVPGRLWLPRERPGPHPLVLLQHGAGGSKQADYIGATAGPWVEAGAAVATIDFPLHGERVNVKLATQLAALLDAEGRERTPQALALWSDFVRQAVIDLRRALDGLVELDVVDAERIGYASFSLGTILGGVFCGLDPRPRAAALAIGGGGFGPPEVDPLTYLPLFAPRPVMFVGAERDERIPREATERLYAAAGEPKSIAWFDATHGGIPGRALKAMWQFLAPQLGLDEAGG